jgi:hypothetical protein
MRALHCHGAHPCAALYRFQIVIVSALVDFEVGKDPAPRLLGRASLHRDLPLLDDGLNPSK